MFDASDDYDFDSANSSTLSGLFGNAMSSDLSSNRLMYTAPKKPKHESDKKLEEKRETSESGPQSAVLIVKIIWLWKLEGKEYKSMGKHGLALIGSTALKLFEIIAYKEKSNILLRAKVDDKFNFYIQKNKFSSFYDEKSQNWLVKFDNNDQTEFVQKIRAHGAKTTENMETSQEHNIEGPNTKPVLLPKPVITENMEEVLSDTGSQQKANILNRMAKMGQQIIPRKSLHKTTSSDISEDITDSEIEERRTDRKVTLKKYKKQVHEEKISLKNATSQLMPVPSSSYNYPPNVSNPVFYNQPTGFDGATHYLVAQNSELKINLAQISAKLDSILGDNNISCTKADDNILKSKIKALELKCENLQADSENYEKKLFDMQVKCEELINKNNDAELNQKNAIIDRLQEEIASMKMNSGAVDEKYEEYVILMAESEKYRNEIHGLKKTIEIQQLKLKDFEEFYEKNKNNKDLQSTIDHLNAQVANLKLKLRDFEEYWKKTEDEHKYRTQINNEKINRLSDTVKNTMNNMYQSLLNNLDEEYSYSDVQSIIAKCIKSSTFEIIKDIKNIVSDGANVIND